jgi:PAS domain S-box-containing protein/putative nucleotidyltransferase with HDIG domain
VETKKLKIVCIGDNITEITYFTKTVSKALPGTEVYSAINALEGIKLSKIHNPDIIVIDVGVTKEDCLKLSRIIKKEKTLQAIPMLFMTDLESDKTLRLKALKAGAEAFIVKPVDDAILITQLMAMAKIKERNTLILTQKKQLEDLVKSRTRDLKQEIMQRKKTEQDLRISKEIFKTYIEKAPIGIFVCDALGNYIDANTMACQLMMRTKEEVLRLSLTDYLAHDQIDRGLEGFRELVSNGQLAEEYKVRRRNNTEYWINLYATKIDDNCYIAFCVDISERKEGEDRLERLSHHLQILSDELAKTNAKLFLRLQQTINAISTIGEMKDGYTAGHQRRVATLASAIARKMKLSEDVIYNISIGALIHDIGKIHIPSDILNKPGKISNLEFQILQTHVEYSYEIVKDIDFPSQVIDMIHQHHERLDGTGYPQKLVGDQIIIESRILAVADVVEAMMSHRPYRSALGVDAAIEEITKYRGTKFDSKVVDVCIELFRENGFEFLE